jgi:hypothetical protein
VVSKAEKVTEDDLESARTALEEGKARAAQLRESFYEGVVGVTFDDVKSQEAVVEYVEAEIERLSRAKARSEESIRQAALADLKAEMDAHATADGEQFVELLKEAVGPLVAVASAYKGHNDWVASVRTRMVELGVSPVGNRLSASAGDQGLSYGENGEVRSSTRTFVSEYSGDVLQGLLRSLRGHQGIDARYFTGTSEWNFSLDELLERAGSVTQELPAIPEDALFYRHTNGSYHMRGPGSPVPVEDLKRLELRPVTRAEALAHG